MPSPRPAVSWLPAEHAGVCYPRGPEELLEYFGDFFEAPITPEGPLPGAPVSTGGKLAGIIAPHIDFRVSQQAYAQAFLPWLHAPPAETYLILGVGHRSRQEWNLGRQGWETPLGRVGVDSNGVDRLAAVSSRLLAEPAAHRGEHSIEFPVVMLQALHELRGAGDFRIVPLLCGSLVDYLYTDAPPHEDDVAHRLAAAVEEWLAKERAASRRVQVIVSIDGCHVGPRFRHPAKVNELLLLGTELWEEALWSAAEAGSFDSFVSWVRQEGNIRHFDGVGALGLLLLMKRPPRIHRTYYEQWFEEADHSTVTFSSGTLEL